MFNHIKKLYDGKLNLSYLNAVVPGILRTFFSFVLISLLPFYYDHNELVAIISAILIVQISESFGSAGLEALYSRKLKNKQHITLKFHLRMSLLRLLLSSLVYLLLFLIYQFFSRSTLEHYVFYLIILINSFSSIANLFEKNKSQILIKSILFYFIFCILSVFLIIYYKNFITSYILICSGFSIIISPVIFLLLPRDFERDIKYNEIFKIWLPLLQINFLKVLAGSGLIYVMSIFLESTTLVYFFLLDRGKSIVVVFLSAMSTILNLSYSNQELININLNKFIKKIIFIGLILSIIQIFMVSMISNFYNSEGLRPLTAWVYVYCFYPTFFCANFFYYNNFALYNFKENFAMKGLFYYALFNFSSLFIALLGKEFFFFVAGLIFSEMFLFVYLKRKVIGN